MYTGERSVGELVKERQGAEYQMNVNETKIVTDYSRKSGVWSEYILDCAVQFRLQTCLGYDAMMLCGAANSNVGAHYVAVHAVQRAVP